jgi:UDPglucose 6-dehydrogenase
VLSDAHGPRLGRVAFVGLSHLGIVSSVAWASRGIDVLALDPDAALVEQVDAGRLPIDEPGLDDLLAASRAQLTFSANLAELATCPVVIVARDVPTDDRNVSDLAPIQRLIDAVEPHLAPSALLVLMSQLPPGYARGVLARLRDRRPDAAVHYLVETLVFGDAIRRATEPERFIVGCAEPADGVHPALLAALGRFDCPIIPMRFESAELTKTAINLYLIGSVTYSNTLADLAETVGADWAEVVPALRLDRRIGPAAYLRPSLGISGGNLERDLITLGGLAHDHGIDATYLDALAAHNTARFRWVLDRLEAHVFAPTPRPRLALWGLAYKRDTGSTKNSPALRLLAEVAGRATVAAWDPLVRQLDPEIGAAVCLTDSRDDALDNADCLVVMTDWPTFADADPAELVRRMRRPLVIDCVGVLNGRGAALRGIEYIAMGSAA